jgi:hypothetical protein
MCCALIGLAGCGGSSRSSSTTQAAAQAGTPQSTTTQSASTSTTTGSSDSPNAEVHGTTTRGAGTTKPVYHSSPNGTSAGAAAPASGSGGDSGSAGGSGSADGSESAGAAASTHNYGSLATFGREASGGDRVAVLAAFHDYLSAIAARNWAAACARLSTPLKRELAQLLARAKGLSGHGCAAALAVLGRAPVSVLREQAQSRVVGVRTDGDHAFVLYRTPQLPHATLAMIREGGRWTAGVLSGASG